MPRNRTISQSEQLFVGPSPATGSHFISGANRPLTFSPGVTGLVRQLYRIQSINDSYAFGTLQPINQFGELGAIDFITIDPPTVNLSFSFIQANMVNESRMGFSLSSGSNIVGAISGILNKTEDERNYFILTRKEGDDVNNNAGAYTQFEFVKGIGNGFITNYTAEASVGNLPTVSVDVEGLNLKIDRADNATGNLSTVPAIIPNVGTPVTNVTYNLPTSTTNPLGDATNATAVSISALRPGDISLSLGYNDLGALGTDIKLQSYSLQIPLSRQGISQLGSKFSFSREIQFPLTATLSVNAIVGDLRTGNLYDLFNECTGRTYNMTIALRNPCNNNTAAGYILRGGQLTSQETSASVGADKTVTLNFQFPIGGPQATGTNIFFSGVSA